mmetsp:Transcript_3228/g.6164  ORF Transcript_3228/g.6164 Transcript_3228/m.6164 type:complete len:911 (+) Transcript_3228:156-2888(+)
MAKLELKKRSMRFNSKLYVVVVGAVMIVCQWTKMDFAMADEVNTISAAGLVVEPASNSLKIKGEDYSESSYEVDRDLRQNGKKKRKTNRTRDRTMGRGKKTTTRKRKPVTKKRRGRNERKKQRRGGKRAKKTKKTNNNRKKKSNNENQRRLMDFYPSWSELTCLNDGKYPKYYETNKPAYFSDSAAACCRKHFKGLVKECVRLSKEKCDNSDGWGGGPNGKTGTSPWGGGSKSGKSSWGGGGKAGKASWGGGAKSGKSASSGWGGHCPECPPVIIYPPKIESDIPTYMPTYIPTYMPTTYTPTSFPTQYPTYGGAFPTYKPTANEPVNPIPTYFPTYSNGTYFPTYGTYSPTISPTFSSSMSPTDTPTQSPTTSDATFTPTVNPTFSPTQSPTQPDETFIPTSNPTFSPTFSPTGSDETFTPTVNPTFSPTEIPIEVTSVPTVSQSFSPTVSPTTEDFTSSSPTFIPTEAPTSENVDTTFTPTASPVSIAFPTTSPTAETDEPTGNIRTQSPTYVVVVDFPTISPTYLTTIQFESTELIFWGDPSSAGIVLTEDVVIPQNVDELVVDASAGSFYTLTVLSDGTVGVAGVIDSVDTYRGHFGIPTLSLQQGANELQVIETVVVDGLEITAPLFRRVIAGAESSSGSGEIHSMFIDVNGNVFATGNNLDGQLCLGDNDDRFIPELVTLPEPATDVAVGSDFTLILTESGSVFGCGSNRVGQIGIGDVLQSNVPDDNNGLSDVESISAGLDFALVKADDGLFVMGSNDFGQLCVDTESAALLSPSLLLDVSGESVLTFEAGASSSYLLFDDGSVAACGLNDVGQLGDGSFDDKLRTTVVIPGGVAILRIDSGPSASSAFFAGDDENLYATGLNDRGQLGLGDTTTRDTPTTVEFTEPVGIIDITASSTHSLLR